jgi:hypothetical protein
MNATSKRVVFNEQPARGRRRSTALRAVLLGWALLYSRHGNDWHVIDQFDYESYCTRVLETRVDEETRAAIGGALAVQAADNPLRVEAYHRAVQHVRARFKCAPET